MVDLGETLDIWKFPRELTDHEIFQDVQLLVHRPPFDCTSRNHTTECNLLYVSPLSDEQWIVEKNLHVQFSENTPNIAGSGPNWLFDIDALTKSINNKPVVAGNQSNGSTCTKACDNAGKARMEAVPGKDYILLPEWPADPLFSQSSKSSPDVGFKPSREEEKKDAEDPRNESGNPTEGKYSEVPRTEEPRIM
ncbi:hypothetical protein Tco_0791366 [Tanacetum coccineum]